MNFKNISDQELENKIQNAVKEENILKIQILHLLAEFEQRRLYAKDHPSLFEYCVKTLKYTAGAAQRRIDTMRAMKLIPEIERKLVSGELNSSSVSQAQRFFRQEAKAGKKYDTEAKKKVLEKLENKTARECEKELVKISPNALPKEGRREITEEHTELKIVLNANQIAKLNKVKALLSNKYSHLTDGELIEVLADLTIKKLDPSAKAARRSLPTLAVEPSTTKEAGVFDAPGKTFGPKGVRPVSDPRYIPASTKSAIWKRDGGRCTHPNCGSTHFIEIDHIVPVALGGLSDFENLRLLCRTHNTQSAIEVFGQEKMQHFMTPKH